MTRQTFVKFVPAVALIALASCGASNEPSNQIKGERAVENATLTKLSLTSDAFRDGQPIPTQFTCDGTDQSPALSWGEPPQGTKSFALVIDDPDAPGGTFRHWAAFNIPARARELPAGGNPFGGALGQAVNDFGKAGYGGPCPPRGHGPHHYRFKLFALDVDRLDVGASPKVTDVEKEALKHAIAQGELVGTYERK